MKISQSNVSLDAQRSFLAEYQKNESLRVMVGGKTLSETSSDKATMNAGDIIDVVRITEKAALLNQARNMTSNEAPPVGQSEQDLEDGSSLDPRFETMRRILEMLTGKKIRVGNLQDHKGEQSAHPVAQSKKPDAGGQQPAPVGWGVAYDFQEQYHEIEQTSFSASGTMVTQDGQKVAFKLELTMTREYIESTSISVRAGDAAFIDPLVVNFAGRAAELSDMRFAFDLNGDGAAEKVPYLMPGSGYLAFDRNHDGKINDGSELFGPSTGSGFAELSLFDSDKNGWIDENDPIFHDLRIWMQESPGVSSLYSLDEKRIGALLLDSAKSEFSLNGEDNVQLGKIVRTGIFLGNDGRAGTLQEVDLTG